MGVQSQFYVQFFDVSPHIGPCSPVVLVDESMRLFVGEWGCIGGCISKLSGAIARPPLNEETPVPQSETGVFIVQDSSGNYYLMGDEGLEEPLEIPKEKRISEIGGARGGAMRPDATLIELSECWPHLPEQIRLKIMKLVRSVDSTNTTRS